MSISGPDQPKPNLTIRIPGSEPKLLPQDKATRAIGKKVLAQNEKPTNKTGPRRQIKGTKVQPGNALPTQAVAAKALPGTTKVAAPAAERVPAKVSVSNAPHGIRALIDGLLKSLMATLTALVTWRQQAPAAPTSTALPKAVEKLPTAEEKDAISAVRVLVSDFGKILEQKFSWETPTSFRTFRNTHRDLSAALTNMDTSLMDPSKRAKKLREIEGEALRQTVLYQIDVIEAGFKVDPSARERSSFATGIIPSVFEGVKSKLANGGSAEAINILDLQRGIDGIKAYIAAKPPTTEEMKKIDSVAKLIDDFDASLKQTFSWPIPDSLAKFKETHLALKERILEMPNSIMDPSVRAAKLKKLEDEVLKQMAQYQTAVIDAAIKEHPSLIDREKSTFADMAQGASLRVKSRLGEGLPIERIDIGDLNKAIKSIKEHLEANPKL